MIQIAIFAISLVVCCLVLKQYNSTISMLLAIGGAIIIFLYSSDKISLVINQLISISSGISGALTYIKLMLKVLGIILVAQLVSDICRDSGENAVASVVETVSKVIVVALIMPLFETVISIVTGLLK